MKMDEGLDTGPMLLQRSVPIDRTATTATLQTLLATLGAEALLEALAQIASGTAQPRAQPAQGVTHAAKLDKAEAVIDWRSSALAIERQVRAFDPWPVAETRWAGEPLRVLAAHARGGEPLARSNPPADAGTVVAVEREAILVACGEGQLAITALQRPGRKRLSAAEFANAGLISRGERLG